MFYHPGCLSHLRCAFVFVLAMCVICTWSYCETIIACFWYLAACHHWLAGCLKTSNITQAGTGRGRHLCLYSASSIKCTKPRFTVTLATLTAALLYAFKISDLCEEEEGSYKIFYALGHLIDVNAL